MSKIRYKLIESTPKPSFGRFVKRTFGLDLFKGLFLTFRELCRPSSIVTIKYPLEKIPLSPRYRAVHKLMRLLDSGNPRCIGCGLCEKICVSNCIKIETSFGADSRKKIESYSINFGRCIYCGLCAEVCPELAIIHGDRYENASEQRAHFKLQDDLLTPINLAQNGQIAEFSGYGSVSQNCDNLIKKTPLSCNQEGVLSESVESKNIKDSADSAESKNPKDSATSALKSPLSNQKDAKC